MSTASSIGSATIQPDDPDAPRSVIRVDGRCVEGTLGRLERGEQGHPMTRPALEKIRTQATQLLEDIVGAYDMRIARGEVGLSGCARAGALPTSAESSPTGLLYGKVQSGKTAAMIVATAMAVDNGFRVIIVLTSNNIKLVRQTYARFSILDGPLVYSSLDGGSANYQWEQDEKHIRHWAPDTGVVFVCAKEDGHLEALIRFLQKIGARELPALIMDDEADHATPDTNVAKRARGHADAEYSTTFRLVVDNDREPGMSLRESVPHNVFLQITATPYGLLLQNLRNPLRPAFTYLLEPGEGYTGGEFFFSLATETPVPPLVYVGETESAQLDKPRADPPPGLMQAVAFFVFAGASHRLHRGSPPKTGYSFLCHTSAQQSKHKTLADMIRRYVDSLAQSLVEGPAAALSRPEVQAAVAELKKTVPGLPLEKDLVAEAGHYLPTRKVLIINSTEGADLPEGGRFNFIVGGNILGRGLTIQDLLVTYYLRQARVSQMDTMHQHARMYGYRKDLKPYTRVYLPQTLAARFRGIHESEESLRNLLTSGGRLRAIPVEVAGNLKATRSNILDVGALSAYRPGQQVYPVEPVHDPKLLAGSVRQIDAQARAAMGGAWTEHVFHQVPIDTIKAIVRTIKVVDDEGDWNTNAILNVLEVLKKKEVLESPYPGMGFLYVRAFAPTRVVLSSGALSGAEQEEARQREAPVLFLFKGRKGSPWLSDIIYPTIVFPNNMPAMVFNWDAEATDAKLGG